MAVRSAKINLFEGEEAISMKVKSESGEILERSVSGSDYMVTNKGNKSNNRFKLMPSYYRRNKDAWVWLKQKLNNDKAYLVADQLAYMAEAYTSRIKGITPDMAIDDVRQALGITWRAAKEALRLLYDTGVIAKVQVSGSSDGVDREFYAFNPFLSFNGTDNPKVLEGFFAETEIAKKFGRINKYNLIEKNNEDEEKVV